MNVAIDYDNTISADVQAWKDVVQILHNFGHEVFLVTSRMGPPLPNDGLFEDVEGWPIQDVLFCGETPKLDHVKSEGVHIDVWIDDSPAAIIRNPYTEEVKQRMADRFEEYEKREIQNGKRQEG